ncbi:MAG: hypothetical protein IJ589_02800, partial [Lachnospiraceae bacterium]|nr:hypothetical protein [Lachnospiraceae bacterium]
NTGSEILILINTGSETESVTLSGSAIEFQTLSAVLLTGEDVVTAEDKTVTLPAMSIAVMTK